MNKKDFTRLNTRLLLCILVCSIQSTSWSQRPADEKKSFSLFIHYVGKDSGFTNPALGLQTAFAGETEAITYINKIPQLLASKGYPIASVDSFWQQTDSLHIQLYTGQKYNWVQLSANNIEKPALDAAGFTSKNYSNKPLNMAQLQTLQERLLSYYERQGYPFASVFLDSIQLKSDSMSAVLKIDKAVLYHIDSIRMYGKVKLSKKFLQRYFDIPNGSIYNKEKLQQVDKRMLELPFLTPAQPSDLTMLGSGSVLNLYANPKRSSQINFLLGFLPASSENSKLQITGDVNLDLKNMFGTAEEILLKWQQLQPKSPRLNLGYTQPYVFNSPFGINFLFDLFKKDSNFLQVNALAGVQYNLSANQNGRLFLQLQNNTLLSGAVDTNLIKMQKELPPNVDVSAVNVGINYELLATNYRYNPRKGNEINLVSVVGIKNIRQNTDIINIKDPSFNYAGLYDSIKPRSYQLRVKLTASHYFPVSKASTVKTTLHGGYYMSPNIFRNELFQIGGYKLLRGFNEESIYASQYAVFSAEYRYLVSLNSYLFGFTDIGLVKNKYQSVDVNNQLVGIGLGILYETKAGLLNLSYAFGIRDDVKFNIREASKLHFGYINYF
ncbi:MAG: BamA/TamA family outer membrane protein [Gloeobacteraceae cyanobacterium ES-bin-316]|nr:BamA/TamA family outer membrane protein [Ferruginibacter sp.]